MKRYLLCSVLALTVALSGCSFFETESAEEKKERIVDEMVDRLTEKYEDEVDDDDVFEVYDLSKGGNQAWFNYGFYPATGEYDGDEFQVQIETNGKKFGECIDNYYGVLYGDDAISDLEYLISDCYLLEDVWMEFELCEDIPDEDEVHEHLVLHGSCDVYDWDELEEICDLVDTLDEEGFKHNIYIYYDQMSAGTSGRSSDDIREFFESKKDD